MATSEPEPLPTPYEHLRRAWLAMPEAQWLQVWKWRSKFSDRHPPGERTVMVEVARERMGMPLRRAAVAHIGRTADGREGCFLEYPGPTLADHSQLMPGAEWQVFGVADDLAFLEQWRRTHPPRPAATTRSPKRGRRQSALPNLPKDGEHG